MDSENTYYSLNLLLTVKVCVFREKSHLNTLLNQIITTQNGVLIFAKLVHSSMKKTITAHSNRHRTIETLYYIHNPALPNKKNMQYFKAGLKKH